MNANSTKIFSWKTALLLSFGVGLLATGLSIFIQAESYTLQGPPNHLVEGPKSVVAAPAIVGFGSSFEIPGKPVRLLIPAIGVDAAIQSVGLSWTGNGTMGVPTNFTDVAWYNPGPLPGMPGSAVIDGHLDGKKVAKAVFYDLGNLKPGDIVNVLDGNGKMWRFSVINNRTYDYNATTSDVFSGDASKARLNLITCAGDWIKNQKLYDKRIVVFTELVTTNTVSRLE